MSNFGFYWNSFYSPVPGSKVSSSTSSFVGMGGLSNSSLHRAVWTLLLCGPGLSIINPAGLAIMNPAGTSRQEDEAGGCLGQVAWEKGLDP